jgi:hypothetical protein
LTYPPPETEAGVQARRNAIIDGSRDTYARPRQEVEAEFSRSMAKVLRDAPKETNKAKAVPSPIPTEPTTKPVVNAPEPSKQEEVSLVESEVPNPKTSSRKAKPVRVIQSPAMMGKGGQEHRALQQHIKKWAEGFGYKATIEKQLEGGGSVDIVLEKEELCIACEITVTTTPDHELKNIQKCLEDDFTHVIALSQDRKKIQTIRELAKIALPKSNLDRVHFLEEKDFYRFVLDIEAKNASHQTKSKGWTVNVNYRHAPEVEQQSARDTINKTVLDAMKRKQDANEEDLSI